MLQFNFEEEKVKQKIRELGAKRVLLQFPEGLKPSAFKIARFIEKESGAIVIVSADPCYGACDVATQDAESLGAELIIHYGHSKILKHELIPTIYIEARSNLTIKDVLEKALPKLKKWKKIGLTTTIQHVQTLNKVRERLLEAKKTVIVGNAGSLPYPGQVTGCDYDNASSIAKDVEVFIFIGGGRFHAIGVALSTSKPTLVINPYEKSICSVDNEIGKIFRERWAMINKVKKAKRIAVLVGLKLGQKKIEGALYVKNKLEKHRKEVCLFAAKEITPEILIEFPDVDAYVNTACPRISVDAALKFHKPVITGNEALVVIGDISWEELCKRGLFGKKN